MRLYRWRNCGLTAEKFNVVGLHPTPDQGGLLVLSKTSMLSCQLDIPISRSKRPLAFALGCSKTPLTELKAPWALSVLMLSRQTLVPDSTDAISASMPRPRKEHKCPAATPRGWWTSVDAVWTVNSERIMPVRSFAIWTKPNRLDFDFYDKSHWPQWLFYCRGMRHLSFDAALPPESLRPNGREV